MNKAPRGDSKLKLLPKEAQEKIISWRNSMSHAATLKKIRDELDLTVGGATLTEFYQWWYLSKDLQEAASFADLAKEELSKIPELAGNQEKLQQATQALFELRAAKSNDPKMWALLRQVDQFEREVRRKELELTLKRKELDLKEQKYQRDTCLLFLKWREDTRASEIADSATSNEKKIAALRELMFADLEGGEG